MRGRLRSPHPQPRRTRRGAVGRCAPLDDSAAVTGRCCPMSVSPVCPRCGEPLVVRPGSTAQAWCHVHGAVTPLHHTVLVAHDAISAVTADARVPAWVPDPMPAGWSVTGHGLGRRARRAGDRRRLRRPRPAGRLGRARARRRGARHRRRLRLRRAARTRPRRRHRRAVVGRRQGGRPARPAVGRADRPTTAPPSSARPTASGCGWSCGR